MSSSSSGDEHEEDLYVGADEVADEIQDAEGEPMADSDTEEDKILLEDDSIQGFFGHSEGGVFSIDIHPTQQNVVVSGGGDDHAYVWQLDTGEQLAELDQHEDSVSAVRFSHDGSLVATGAMDGRINVYNVDKRERCASLEGPNEIVWIDWHPRGNVLVAGTDDGSLWMWSLPAGNFMQVFRGHSAPATCGRFTHDGRNIVSGSEDGSLIIWDPKTAAIVHKFTSADERFHQEGITSLAISRDDQIILTGSMDGTAKLVHANGSILGSLENASESVEAVGLCDALPFAATGSVDGSLSIWDINTLRLRTTLKHEDAVTRLLWHRESPLLTSASMDASVRTWDARSGESVRVWKGHQEGIMDLALTNDGGKAVTASDDSCCLVFGEKH